MNATHVPYKTKAVSTTTVISGGSHQASVRSVRACTAGRGAASAGSTVVVTRRKLSVALLHQMAAARPRKARSRAQCDTGIRLLAYNEARQREGERWPRRGSEASRS